MVVFKMTKEERRILQVWIEELSLLNLGTGLYEHVIGETHERPGSEPEPIVNISLAPGFQIGAYRRRSKFAKEGITGTIETGLMEKVVVSIYERSWLDHIMAVTNRPLSLELREYEYYHGIVASIAEATFARLVAIHLADEADMGSEHPNYPLLTIYDDDHILDKMREEVEFPDDVEPFRSFLADARAEQPALRLGGSYGQRNLISNYINDLDLKTLFVLPLGLGGERQGFLTIGYAIDIGLSETVELAFRSMGGHAVAAVENYRKIQDLDRLRQQLMTDHIESTQLELMQGFRHVAGGELFNATYAMKKINESRDGRGKGADQYFDQLSAALSKLSISLGQMAQLRKFERGFDQCDIMEVFEDATKSVQYQLEKSGVQVRRERRGSMRVTANRLGLQYAFTNLIINSIQAFDEGGNKRDRMISFIGTRGDKDITLDYSDNGPGIRIGVGTIHSADDIWDPGKSSKKNGTGYGLPFVRDMIQREHGGSINLRPSHRGVTFRIILRAD